MTRWMFPGSFDPPTLGHLDVLRRAARLCDELVVAVLHNPAKRGLFTPEQRMEMIRRVAADLPNVRVVSSDALLVQAAAAFEITCVVRGLRTSHDSAGEIQMAQLNRAMLPGLEVLMIPTAPSFAFISSSYVREIAAKHGDISTFVPAEILPDVLAAYEV